jgi:hypothetical protein
MAQHGVSDSELAKLSDVERAALEEEETEAAGEEGAGDEIADEEEAEIEAKGKEAADEEKEGEEKEPDKEAEEEAEEPEPEKEVPAAAAAEEDEDDEIVFARTPRLPVRHVEGYDEKLKALNDQREALTLQFKDGELESDDYFAKVGKIADDKAELQRAEDRARFAEEHNAAADSQDFIAEAQAFMAHARKTEGVDYKKGAVKVDGKDVRLVDVYDKYVRLLANDPDNAQRPGRWFLQEAHAIVKARFGGKPKLSSVPKTLGGIPNAQDTETREGEGEFAALDKLTGMELEHALARLTPEQQDRYLRAG